jgi:hypothetical protein
MTQYWLLIVQIVILVVQIYLAFKTKILFEETRAVMGLKSKNLLSEVAHKNWMPCPQSTGIVTVNKMLDDIKEAHEKTKEE